MMTEEDIIHLLKPFIPDQNYEICNYEPGVIVIETPHKLADDVRHYISKTINDRSVADVRFFVTVLHDHDQYCGCCIQEIKRRAQDIKIDENGGIPYEITGTKHYDGVWIHEFNHVANARCVTIPVEKEVVTGNPYIDNALENYKNFCEGEEHENN